MSYKKIILLITLIMTNLSLAAIESEIEKDYQKLIGSCKKEDFVKNLDESREIFIKNFDRLTLKQIDQLGFKETRTKKDMFLNYYRILFPYKMPKSEILKSHFMGCYIYFDEYLKDFSENSHVKWERCLNVYYHGDLPEFEKTLLTCTQKMITKK